MRLVALAIAIMITTTSHACADNPWSRVDPGNSITQNISKAPDAVVQIAKKIGALDIPNTLQVTYYVDSRLVQYVLMNYSKGDWTEARLFRVSKGLLETIALPGFDNEIGIVADSRYSHISARPKHNQIVTETSSDNCDPKYFPRHTYSVLGEEIRLIKAEKLVCSTNKAVTVWQATP